MDRNQYWGYCDYKHFETLLNNMDTNNKQEYLKKFFNLNDIIFGNNNNNRNIYDDLNSLPTFWLGSNNSNSPLHYDQFGVNIVIQIYGTKIWYLGKPNCKNINPTRIPFEESTIYSNLDYNDIIKHDHLFKIALNPGDILFVPLHYWHFVCTPPNSLISMSINQWIDSTKYIKNTNIHHLNENITRYLMTSIQFFNGNCNNKSSIMKWKNPDTKLYDETTCLKSIKSCVTNETNLNKCNDKDIQDALIKAATHPDVIQLISKKLLESINI